MAEGKTWGVDLDLESFFDRVNHDILMSRVARKIEDKRVLKLIRRCGVTAYPLRLDRKSRMRRESHVRFREQTGGVPPADSAHVLQQGLTQDLGGQPEQHRDSHRQCQRLQQNTLDFCAVPAAVSLRRKPVAHASAVYRLEPSATAPNGYSACRWPATALSTKPTSGTVGLDSISGSSGIPTSETASLNATLNSQWVQTSGVNAAR